MTPLRLIRLALACLAGVLLAPLVASALEEGTRPIVKEPPPKVPGTTLEIAAEERDPAAGPAKVVVIPVRDQIAKPVLFVIRRGLKDAIDDGADLVILDMKTPGGSLGATFDIMEALEKFDGATATFIDDEAISAGAFISAMTDDIYFAPDGIIGAAAPVSGAGGEIDETMKQKIISYLKARIRALSEGHGYRGQVISAMIDADYVLEIEDEVLKEEGELLSLTATEAARTYGDPPQPLLAAGIAESIEDLLEARYGAEGYELTTLEVTWSEELASMLTTIAPILMGLGMLGLFIEFKTPGFGVFGIIGGVLMLIVFFGHHVAGLSGNEAMLLFFLGVILVLLEILVAPGVFVFALSGIGLMLGSLIWSMADIWPNEPISFSGDLFLGPLQDLGLSLVVAVVGAVAIARFMPRSWVWDRIVLSAAVGDGAQAELQAEVREEEALIGQVGEAATDLFPSGQIVLAGEWHEAKTAVGTINKGTPVRVTGRDGFSLLVKAIEEGEV